MDLFEAVRTRRSASGLLNESPDGKELAGLVELAMTAPDHAGLRPWRLVVLRDEARVALGAAMAEAEGIPETAAKTAAKPLRAPLLLGIVFRPREHPKVPEWEQIAAVSGMAVTLELLLHGQGWGAVWRTGRLVEAEPVRRMMGVGAEERLLGWLYIGRPDPERSRGPRPPLSAEGYISVLEPGEPAL
ncbi:MAG TPA: nitroreductase [Micromonosporaceae bacterium]|nr:nitroreductase [Micromonosporaceae bacterium]